MCETIPKIIYNHCICVFWCKQDGDKIVQYTYKRKDSNKRDDPCYPDKIPVSIRVTSYCPVFAVRSNGQLLKRIKIWLKNSQAICKCLFDEHSLPVILGHLPVRCISWYRPYYIYLCTFYEAYTRMKWQIYNRQAADVHANLHSNEHNNLLYEYYIVYWVFYFQYYI